MAILWGMSDTARSFQSPDPGLDPASTDGIDDLFDVMPGLDIVTPDSKPGPDVISPGSWWTLAEAVTHLSVNEKTLRRWIKQGKVTAIKVQGARGEEWRIEPGQVRTSLESQKPGLDIVSPDIIITSQSQAIDIDTEQVIELRVRLEIFERENQQLKEQLQGATYRNGYLEARLEGKEQEIKLLTDSQHKPISLWQRVKEIFYRH